MANTEKENNGSLCIETQILQGNNDSLRVVGDNVFHTLGESIWEEVHENPNGISIVVDWDDNETGEGTLRIEGRE
jgi:hypothetical protein